MFGYIILVIVIYLIIGFIIGKAMENAAADKGYGTEAHAFAMCFWLGVIGCIYVAALPDKIQQKQNQKIIDLLSAKEDKTKNTYTNSGNTIPKHLFRCDKCGKMIEGFPCAHCGYEVEATENNTAADDSTRCPHCDRKITVPTGTMSAQCPWCGKNIIF